MRFIIPLLFLFLASTLLAHNPQMATFNVRNYDAVWLIEGSFAQAGLKAAMINSYGAVEVSSWSVEDYKKQVIAYVRDHISIRDHGESIQLGEGAIRLGSHQTDVKFVLTSWSSDPNKTVRINCLMENEHHQNVLKVASIAPGEHFVLSEENAFTTSLMNPAIQSKKQAGLGFLSFGAAVFLVISLLVAFIIRRENRSSTSITKE